MHDPTVPSPNADGQPTPDPDNTPTADTESNSARLPVEPADFKPLLEEMPTAELIEATGGTLSDGSSAPAEALKDPISVAEAVLRRTPPIPPQFQNLAANGGAIGALALGVLSILGALLTDWSILNGLLGMTMAGWGWTSKLKRTTLIGFLLCVTGILICVIT